MKKYMFIGFIALFLLDSMHPAFAQRETLEYLLETTIVLSENDKTIELKEKLASASFMLESEANTRGNSMKSKLLMQAKILKNFSLSAEEGTLKTDTLNKTINTIRLLLGINQIKNLLEDGKSGLLGNAEAVTNSINFLQLGKVILSPEKQQKLDDLLESISKIVIQLDSKDVNAKVTASSTKKKLEKIVDLVSEAI